MECFSREAVQYGGLPERNRHVLQEWYFRLVRFMESSPWKCTFKFPQRREQGKSLSRGISTAIGNLLFWMCIFKRRKFRPLPDVPLRHAGEGNELEQESFHRFSVSVFCVTSNGLPTNHTKFVRRVICVSSCGVLNCNNSIYVPKYWSSGPMLEIMNTFV